MEQDPYIGKHFEVEGYHFVVNHRMIKKKDMSGKYKHLVHYIPEILYFCIDKKRQEFILLCNTSFKRGMEV